MKKIIFSLAFILTSQAMAKGSIPAASEWDKKPEEVFSEAKAVPMQPLRKMDISDLQEKSKALNPMTPPRELTPEDFKLKPEELNKILQERMEQRLIWDNEKIVQSDSLESLDWQVVAELNEMATQVWNHLLSCYHGDVSQIRAAYIKGNVCSSAAEELKSLRQSVSGFLSSSIVQTLDITEPPGLNLYAYHPSKYKLSTDRLQPYLRYMNQMPARNPHPLLVQMLLEYIAAGYPMNYGGHACAVLQCLTPFHSRMIVDSDDRHWTPRGYSDNRQAEQERVEDIQWVEALLNAKELPVLSEKQLQNQNLVLLRQGKTAVRLLNHLSTGKMVCSDWGLWPTATLEMTGVMAQSTYEISNLRIDNDDLKFFVTRLLESCDQDIPLTVFGPGSREKADLESIAKIGGWRKLLERQL